MNAVDGRKIRENKRARLLSVLLFPRFSRNEKARNRAQETPLSFFSPLPYLTDVRTRLNEAPQQFNQTLNRCLTIPTVAIFPILFFPGCTSVNFQSARDETTLLAVGKWDIFHILLFRGYYADISCLAKNCTILIELLASDSRGNLIIIKHSINTLLHYY